MGGSHQEVRQHDIIVYKSGGGGLAATFDLAAFLVSMITLVKKSVNHLRTVTSMRKTRKYREETKTCFAAIFAQDLLSIR